MTGNQVAAHRRHLGLGVAEFGRALGYHGTGSTLSRMIRRAEAKGHGAVNERLACRVTAHADAARLELPPLTPAREPSTVPSR